MIVIPAAGVGSRFRSAGYKHPKWQLTLGNRTLLEWSLLSFSRVFDTDSFLVISGDPNMETIVRNFESEERVKEVFFVMLDEPSRGQADTVRKGLSILGVPETESITIFNTDTMRPGFVPTKRQLSSDGWLECVEVEGNHWSFVYEDSEVPGRALRVEEKKRISKNACTGVYHFAERKLFEDSFLRRYSNTQDSEMFVAPLFNELITEGYEVCFDVIDKSDVFFAGTPVEYESAVIITEQITRRFAKYSLDEGDFL